MISIKKIWQPAIEEVIKKHVIVERLKGASLEVLTSLFLLAASICAFVAINDAFGYTLGAVLIVGAVAFSYYITYPKSMEAYLKQYGREEVDEMIKRMQNIISNATQKQFPDLVPSEYAMIAKSYLIALEEIKTLLDGTMTTYRAIQKEYIDSGLKRDVVAFSAQYRELIQGRAHERFYGRSHEKYQFTEDFKNSSQNKVLKLRRLQNLIFMNLRQVKKPKIYVYKDEYRRVLLGDSVISEGMRAWLLILPYDEDEARLPICEILELPITTSRVMRSYFKTPVKANETN